jgi:hypothetical protein
MSTVELQGAPREENLKKAGGNQPADQGRRADFDYAGLMQAQTKEKGFVKNGLVKAREKLTALKGKLQHKNESDASSVVDNGALANKILDRQHQIADRAIKLKPASIESYSGGVRKITSRNPDRKGIHVDFAESGKITMELTDALDGKRVTYNQFSQADTAGSKVLTVEDPAANEGRGQKTHFFVSPEGKFRKVVEDERRDSAGNLRVRVGEASETDKAFLETAFDKMAEKLSNPVLRHLKRHKGRPAAPPARQAASHEQSPVQKQDVQTNSADNPRKEIPRNARYNTLLDDVLGGDALQGSEKRFTPAELAKILEDVRRGAVTIEHVTRSGDLRRKVSEALGIPYK